MEARFASEDEIAIWDSLIALNPNGGQVFQLKAFADLKLSSLWTPRFLVIDGIYCSVLERSVTGLGKFWYAPKGPGVSDDAQLKTFALKLRPFAASHNVFAVRLEPELIDNPTNRTTLKEIGLVRHKGIQAENTIIVDIDKPIDQVVASFNGKTRYNIRQAEKEHLTIELVETTDQNCEIFYKLMSETIAGRSYLRPLSYFKKFWKGYAGSNAGFFMFAHKGKELQAIDFVMINGIKAARKDAGSNREHSIRGASALLEVEVIKELQKRGVKYYDLYGSPPANRLKDPTHPYYGFGTFKSGFNETVTDFVGCQDLVIKPWAYKYWQRAGERLEHRKYRKKHGDRYY